MEPENKSRIRTKMILRFLDLEQPQARSQENVNCATGALVDAYSVANLIFDFQTSNSLNALIPRNCFPRTELFFNLEKSHYVWDIIPAQVVVFHRLEASCKVGNRFPYCQPVE